MVHQSSRSVHCGLLLPFHYHEWVISVHDASDMRVCWVVGTSCPERNFSPWYIEQRLHVPGYQRGQQVLHSEQCVVCSCSLNRPLPVLPPLHDCAALPGRWLTPCRQL